MPNSIRQESAESSAKWRGRKSHFARFGIIRESACCLLCRYRHNRHTFATRALEQCSTRREAVARHFVALATYMGHTDIAHTFWYLEATPELMTDIAAAAEALIAKEDL